MAGTMSPISGAAGDLGLGSMLGDQRDDETEEEKRRRELGLPPAKSAQSLAATQLYGYGQTGIAPMTGLGASRGGR